MLPMTEARLRQAAPAILFALAAFASGPALAQDEGSVDDVMMSVVGQENANEQAFAEEIGLPDPNNEGAGPSESARENAAFGIDMADEARRLREGSGNRSEAARQLGRDTNEVGRNNGPAGPAD